MKHELNWSTGAIIQNVSERKVRRKKVAVKVIHGENIRFQESDFLVACLDWKENL